MKHLLTLFFTCSIAALIAQTPATIQGRNISIKYTPLKNTKVYLGSHYGNTMALFDSATLNDKGEGAFRGSQKLTGGVYFIVTKEPEYAIQFDLLMDDQQQFSITADTAFKDKTVITGSADNTMFTDFKKTAAAQDKQIRALRTGFDEKKAKTKEDTTTYLKEAGRLTKYVKDYQDSITKNYPDALLSALFNLTKRPAVPEIPIVNGKPDSSYPYHYVRGHFWDDMDFADDRLLHTDFFEQKVDEYFRDYIYPDADSIIKEVNFMLLSAKMGKEMYPFLLTKFTRQYMNPKYMGQDKVFVYLFEHFYAKGDTILLDPANRKIVSERAYNLMANQIGLPAAPMSFPDTSGKLMVPLYGIQSPFTVVVFWDPTCGHCKIEIPRLDSMYRAKWKALGVAIYAVNTNQEETPAWKKYIVDNKLFGWIHGHDTKEVQLATEKAHQMNFRQAYDMHMTPTLYLLDKDKNIIAKQLSMEQFDELIKIKMAKSK